LNIQIINYDGEKIVNMNGDYTVTSISKPRSLDEFDINIIDLNSKCLWRYDGRDKNSINSYNDISNLNIMLGNTSNSKTLIILPQDFTFYYGFGYHGSKHQSFAYSTELKNCLPFVKDKVIGTLIPNNMQLTPFNLFYENTVTHIDGLDYDASFNFAISDNYISRAITMSKSSNKITALKMADRLFLATINVLKSDNHLLTFLKKCNWLTNQETYPQWLIEYPILDDVGLNALISEKEEAISEAQVSIHNAKEKLEHNLEYKSILFTNGEFLVNIVSKILEQLLETDLSGFEDKKKEDFLIPIDDNLEFIGEIKGVTSNIKSEHVSQLDVHYQKRLDHLASENETKTVKALLIINPLRNTAVNERQPVHEEQIKLAIRNGALIVETSTLLYIYENFVNSKINSNSCKDMFQAKIGLLSQEDVNQYYINNG